MNVRNVLLGLGVLAFAAPAVASISLTVGQTIKATSYDFFDETKFNTSGIPIALSDGAYAAALFNGQGAGVTAPGVGGNAALNAAMGVPGGYGGPWEFATGLPEADQPLALLGQPGTAVPLVLQDVLVAKPPDPVVGRISGMLNGMTNGVISFLFADNIKIFSMSLIGSGRNPNDGYGGPIWFDFFGRQGEHLQTISVPTVVDTAYSFVSSGLDIAGVQITHQDPFGLGYSRMWFGVPEPSALGLLVMGLAAMRIRPGSWRQRWSGRTAACNGCP
jgi:hypothetical protein